MRVYPNVHLAAAHVSVATLGWRKISGDSFSRGDKPGTLRNSEDEVDCAALRGRIEFDVDYLVPPGNPQNAIERPIFVGVAGRHIVCTYKVFPVRNKA